MDDKIRSLLAQIARLEDELRSTLHDREERLYYHFKGRKVEFERSIRETHRKLKRGILRWIVTDRPLNFLTAPMIYSMIVPMLMLDLFVSIYQWTCFPVYGIARVKRGDYIVLDRNHLAYLNWFERLHCEYCAYGNGLVAYAAEIVARTEQYFCPIKHARKILGTHARYDRFLPYGEAHDYHARLESFRKALAKEARSGS